MLAPFETKSVRMAPLLLVSVQAPMEDVGRIMDHVARIAPLALGKYGSNAFRSAAGIERYRPLEGTGEAIRKRPGVVEVAFRLADDRDMLARVVEAIFQAHSCREPVIAVCEILASRSKGLDDKANLHRWRNTAGDGKTSGPAARPLSLRDD